MDSNGDQGFAWQTGVWDGMSRLYEQEIDRRFAPVVGGVLGRAKLVAGERVLDLGTGTGSVAVEAAVRVGNTGSVVGIDISPEMLELARRRGAGLESLSFRSGRAESIPADDGEFDVVLASLSLMYVIDRAAAAREIARVLRRGGRLVAAVWGAATECDIVLFQQTAGSFAPAPPVSGVGPGAMADAGPFLIELLQAGIEAQVEKETLEFEFFDFESAWEVLAGVTTSSLAPDVRDEAKLAVRSLMWGNSSGPRTFHNLTQYILGRR